METKGTPKWQTGMIEAMSFEELRAYARFLNKKCINMEIQLDNATKLINCIQHENTRLKQSQRKGTVKSI